VYVGRERWTDSFDDLGARIVIYLLQRSSDGTEAFQVGQQFRLGQAAGNVDWPDVDLNPVTAREKALYCTKQKDVSRNG